MMFGNLKIIFKILWIEFMKMNVRVKFGFRLWRIAMANSYYIKTYGDFVKQEQSVLDEGRGISLSKDDGRN